MNIFEQHKMFGGISRNHKQIKKIEKEIADKKELKILFICCMTGAYEIKNYLKLNVYFEEKTINELKSAKKYLEKAFDLLAKTDKNMLNITEKEIKEAKDELMKMYDKKEGQENTYVQLNLPTKTEERKIGMLNLVTLKLEDYIKAEYVPKEIKTNIKYARTYLEKFVNLLVEVAG